MTPTLRALSHIVKEKKKQNINAFNNVQYNMTGLQLGLLRIKCIGTLFLRLNLQ